MLSARPPRNAEGKRPDSFRHSLSVRPRLRSTEECKERGRGTWSFKSLNPSRRALQFSPPAFSAFLSKLANSDSIGRFRRGPHRPRVSSTRELTGERIKVSAKDRAGGGNHNRTPGRAHEHISSRTQLGKTEAASWAAVQPSTLFFSQEAAAPRAPRWRLSWPGESGPSPRLHGSPSAEPSGALYQTDPPRSR